MDRPKTIIKENQEKKVPSDWTPEMRLETYRDMAKHVSTDGLVRALGVCNFSLRYALSVIATGDLQDMAKHVSTDGLVRALGVCNFSLRYAVPVME
jgi:diketogulonate reductase-like aldo/keto reductase